MSLLDLGSAYTRLSLNALAYIPTVRVQARLLHYLKLQKASTHACCCSWLCLHDNHRAHMIPSGCRRAYSRLSQFIWKFAVHNVSCMASCMASPSFPSSAPKLSSEA